MASDSIEDQPPHGRRHFFRMGLSRLVGPAADFIERRLPIPLPVVPTHLRPPGALPEVRFLETCFRCGNCAEICPANAIVLVEGRSEDLRGTPVIEPDKQACVICDDLACMKACPSGALRLVDRLEIRIGLAQMDDDLCVRANGEACTICIDQCPLGAIAIGLDPSGRVSVIDPAATGRGCTGCGVCQQHCPTEPRKAIRVVPY